MKFRKKPVVIEAERCIDLLYTATNTWRELPIWFVRAYEKGELVLLPDSLCIRTLEGNMVANKNDWVICGVKGELYPCKPDIFEATYEAAND